MEEDSGICHDIGTDKKRNKEEGMAILCDNHRYGSYGKTESSERMKEWVNREGVHLCERGGISQNSFGQ